VNDFDSKLFRMQNCLLSFNDLSRFDIYLRNSEWNNITRKCYYIKQDRTEENKINQFEDEFNGNVSS
jgi:hypothetical protein